MATETEIKIIMTLDDQVSAKLETVKLKQEAVRIATEEVTKSGKVYANEELRKIDILKKSIELSDKEHKGLLNQAESIRKVENELNRLNPSANTFNNTLSRIEGQTVKANSQLTAMGRIIQDAPYGFNAISNNISNTIEQMGYLYTTTGSVSGAFSALASTLFSPVGLLIGLSALPGIIQLVSGLFDEAKSKTDEYKESLDKLLEVGDKRDKLFITTEQARASKELLENQNKTLGKEIQLAKASKERLAFQGKELDNYEEIIKSKEAQKAQNLLDINYLKERLSVLDQTEKQYKRLEELGAKTKQSDKSTSTLEIDVKYKFEDEQAKLDEQQRQSENEIYELSRLHEIEIQQLKWEGIKVSTDRLNELNSNQQSDLLELEAQKSQLSEVEYNNRLNNLTSFYSESIRLAQESQDREIESGYELLEKRKAIEIELIEFKKIALKLEKDQQDKDIAEFELKVKKVQSDADLAARCSLASCSARALRTATLMYFSNNSFLFTI